MGFKISKALRATTEMVREQISIVDTNTLELAFSFYNDRVEFENAGNEARDYKTYYISQYTQSYASFNSHEKIGRLAIETFEFEDFEDAREFFADLPYSFLQKANSYLVKDKTRWADIVKARKNKNQAEFVAWLQKQYGSGTSTPKHPKVKIEVRHLKAVIALLKKNNIVVPEVLKDAVSK